MAVPPEPPEADSVPPVPVLTGESLKLALENAQAGQWEHAPRVVRLAYGLNVAAAIVLGIAVLMSFVFSNGSFRSYGGSGLLMLIGIGALSGSIGLRVGRSDAWRAQWFLSIAGLLFFPVGTIAGILVLIQWARPEVRSWFKAAEARNELWG